MNHSCIIVLLIFLFLFSERLLVVTEHYQQTLKNVAKSGKYSVYVTSIDTLYMLAQSQIVFIFFSAVHCITINVLPYGYMFVTFLHEIFQ